MGQGLSARALGKLLGVSDTAVRKAAKTGRIPKMEDGTYDEVAVRSAWGRSTDPARNKVREPTNPTSEPRFAGARTTPVRTEHDAKRAVALIAQVLSGEGVTYAGEIDYNAARTADTILKAYSRDLANAQRRKELVPIARVKDHVGKAFIGLRQAVQRLPSRHVPAMAAELGCDPGELDRVLNKAIAAELDELAAPVVRA